MAVPAGAVYKDGIACSADGAIYVTPSGTAAITGGNTPFVEAHYQIPIGNAGSGSMGNNGAVTFTTALGMAYANAYMLLPAGAIAAGVPAVPDYYLVQMSSTTVGTVFNNRLADNLDSFGGPKLPASTTAFVTTGPGAFTAAVTATTMLTWTLPSSAIGTSGELYIETELAPTNNANAKNFTQTFGGSATVNNSIASTPFVKDLVEVCNRGSASSQIAYHTITLASSIAHGANGLSINTGSSVAIAFQSTHSGAATDHVFIERLKISALTP